MFWYIEIQNNFSDEIIEDIKNWLLKNSRYLGGYKKLVDSLFDECMEASWSTYREDMIGLSKAFPDLHFIVSCESEDANDYDADTREYYFNGKFEVAEIQHIFTKPTIW